MAKDKVKKWLLILGAVAGWVALGAKFLGENLDLLPF